MECYLNVLGKGDSEMKRFFEILKVVIRKRISALILSFIFLDVVALVFGYATFSNLLITLILAAAYYFIVVVSILLEEKRGY